MSTKFLDADKTSTEAALFWNFVRDLPYIAMLGMALIGVGAVSFTGQSLSGYWLFLAPIYGLMCVIAGWPNAQTRDQRVRLIWKQGLHWFTFLVAMLLVTSPEVRGVENNNAAGLNLMTILASGCFVAGIYIEAWQICVVGAILAIAVPTIAWIEQSALLLILLLVLLVFVTGSILWAVHMRRVLREPLRIADSHGGLDSSSAGKQGGASP